MSCVRVAPCRRPWSWAHSKSAVPRPVPRTEPLRRTASTCQPLGAGSRQAREQGQLHRADERPVGGVAHGHQVVGRVAVDLVEGREVRRQVVVLTASPELLVGEQRRQPGYVGLAGAVDDDGASVHRQSNHR